MTDPLLDIRIGTMVKANAPDPAAYIRSILPYGFESFQPYFWQTMGEKDIPRLAAEKGAYFKERLEEINSPVIREVRGLGLLIGAELKTKTTAYIRALQTEGVLAIPAGMNVLRFLPPAIITYQQLDTVIEKVAQVLAAGS